MFVDLSAEILSALCEKPMSYKELFNKVRAQKPEIAGENRKKSIDFCIEQATLAGIIQDVQGYFCLLHLDGLTPIGLELVGLDAKGVEKNSGKKRVGKKRYASPSPKRRYEKRKRYGNLEKLQKNRNTIQKYQSNDRVVKQSPETRPR